MDGSEKPGRAIRLRTWLLGSAAIVTALVSVTEGLPKIINAWHQAAHAVGVASAPSGGEASFATVAAAIRPTTKRLSVVDSCEKLWLERNLIFNRNGYCFSSTLAKAVFDNRDCLDRRAPLSMHEERRSREIYRWETVLGCYVDVTRDRLVVMDGGEEQAFGANGHAFRGDE